MSIPSKVAHKQADLAPPLIGMLEVAVGQGHPADVALRHFYREHPEFGSRDRRFFSELVFSWFRWRGWLAPADPDRCVMAYLLDAEAPHPAAEALVSGRPDAAAFQPAGGLSLDEKAAQAGRWLGSAPPPLEALVPAWVPGRLHVPPGRLAEDHLARCLAALQIRPPAWLRAPHRGGPRLLEALKRFQVDGRLHPRLPDAIRLEGAPDLSRIAAETAFEVQDLASQCVGNACAPAPGQKWWDCCAGSGGKSLHLADLLGYDGAVLATDSRPASLQGLQRRSAGRRRGVRIERRAWDATRDPAPDRLFDGVLIDAPCSGLGTWARNPDARWRTPEDVVESKRRLQASLLDKAAQTVRPGGRLVYAVCTLTESETRAAVAGFLETHPGFRPDPAPHPLTGEPTDGLFWIWPGEADCSGMFIARLHRA